MAKTKTVFYCQACGYQAAKWLGKCPDCGTWNSLLEERVESAQTGKEARWVATGNHEQGAWDPKPISEIVPVSESRLKTGSAELDRVLGGGVVAGSVVLIGGDPGIGKSTLLLQSLNQLGKGRGKVLYVSGEESPAQIKIRADRLHIASDFLYILAETSLGFPLKGGGGKGDLYVRLTINVPKKVTPEERRLYEELARLAKEKQ
jgi:DNA repair protein RadA/Sms